MNVGGGVEAARCASLSLAAYPTYVSPLPSCISALRSRAVRWEVGAVAIGPARANQSKSTQVFVPVTRPMTAVQRGRRRRPDKRGASRRICSSLFSNAGAERCSRMQASAAFSE